MTLSAYKTSFLDTQKVRGGRGKEERRGGEERRGEERRGGGFES